MTGRSSTQETKESGGAFTPDPPPRRVGEAASALAAMQGAMLKDLVTAQLTALEAFERLIASTGPASEDLMNQFSREFMLGMFRLYPVGQEMGRHSMNAMAELAREYSTMLRSALGSSVNGQGAPGSERAKEEASRANSVTG